MRHIPFFIPGIALILSATWILIRQFPKVPIESKFGAIGIMFWIYGSGIWFLIVQSNYLVNYEIVILSWIQIVSAIWFITGLIIKKVIINKKKHKNERAD